MPGTIHSIIKQVKAAADLLAHLNDYTKIFKGRAVAVYKNDLHESLMRLITFHGECLS